MEKRGTRALSSELRDINILNSKRSQITIFIIIAIVIAGVLLIIFYPQIKRGVSGIIAPASPAASFQACLNEPLNDAINLTSTQGGSINPENTILYKDARIEYLCYTSEYYKTCQIQQPLLREHVENEMASYVDSKSKQCISNLKQDLINKGYTISGEEKLSVSVEAENIVVELSGISIRKESTGERYDKFQVQKKSQLYNLIMLTTSILNSEAIYGDTDTTTYMAYYHDMKVEKYKQSDGSKIFILTNIDSGDKFQFATRSLSWPAGYGEG